MRATRGVALRASEGRLRVLGCALFLSGWLWASQARAEQVALDLHACPDVSESELRALLTLELHGRLLAADAPLPADSEQVRVLCSAATAELTRESTSTRRTLSFAEVAPTFRARALALAIAELLRPEDKPAVRVQAAPPLVEQPAPVAAQAERAPRYHLWGGIQGGAKPVLSLGGALLLRVSIMRLFAWSSALSFSQGHTPIDLGTLRVQDVSLRTGPALSIVLAKFTLLVGAAARVSLLRLSGEPSDKQSAQARSFNSWLFVPSVFLGVAVALGRGALLALEADLGYALPRVRADVQGGGAHTLGSWRASAVLGAGYQW